MAGDLALDPTRPAGPSLPLFRWGALAVLLTTEVVVIGIRFDGDRLYRQSSSWARFIGLCHHLPYLAVAIVTALVLFAGPRLWAELRYSAAVIRERSHSGLYLLAHLATFALFTHLTALLLEGDAHLLTAPAGWAVLWFAAGCATVVLWCLCALPGAVWVRLTRHSLAPLLVGIVIGTAAWVAGQGAEHLEGLDRITFALVYRLLALFCADAYCLPEETLLGTSTFYVCIAPQCAGYEGLGLIWVFLTLYLWVCRRSLRFPRALLLLPLGTLVMFLANAVRIAALVMVGTYLSAEVALGGFHSQAGWLAFNGVALGVVYATRRSAWFSRADVAGRQTTANATAAYLVPLLALIAVTMIGTALSRGFDWLYPLRVLVVAACLWHFRALYRQLPWGWSWTAVALGGLVFLLWLLLDPVTGNRSTDDPVGEGLRALSPAWAVCWLVFRVVGSVVTVPLAEELAFRAYLIRRCQARDFEQVPFQRFTWFSFLASSVLFGLLHGRWIAGTLAGMIYALALYRRGKPADAILAHAVTNALIAAQILTTGSWELWR